ncbi:MAG TPA: hypothetical protein VE134_10220 [Methanomicrobiales archaeon]|nr:hypothetical protein [Methanomicrobiales archaeon]
MKSILYQLMCLALTTYTPVQERRDPTDILLVYERSGGTVYEVGEGMESFGDHLVIYESGRAVLTRGSATMEFTVDSGTLDYIRTLLEEVDFATIPPWNPAAQSKSSYSGTDYPADLPQFIITYRGFRVSAVDTGVPPELEPLIDTLTRMVTDHSAEEALND